MKLLRKRWFTQMGGKLIGVVYVEFDKREMQEFGREFPDAAFIGTCDGNDEDVDIKHIVETGARFPIAAAKSLWDD